MEIVWIFVIPGVKATQESYHSIQTILIGNAGLTKKQGPRKNRGMYVADTVRQSMKFFTMK